MLYCKGWSVNQKSALVTGNKGKGPETAVCLSYLGESEVVTVGTVREEGEEKDNKAIEIRRLGQTMWGLIGYLMTLVSTVSEMGCHWRIWSKGLKFRYRSYFQF